MTNKNDSHTTDTQTTTPDNHTEDLNDLLIEAPDNYILRQTFEPETAQETQNEYPNTSRPQETQTDNQNTQSTLTTQTHDEATSELTKALFSASPGKQPLLDNDVFNHLTTDEVNNILYLNLPTNVTLEQTPYVQFPHRFQKVNSGWIQ